MEVVITGHKSKIAQEFVKLLPPSTRVIESRCEDVHKNLGAGKFLFCQGYLAGKSIDEITPEEFQKTITINYTLIKSAITDIILSNPFARICVISSYSGYRGSYDQTYAHAKSAMNDFIEEVSLNSRHQQVVGIAPWIVQDAGMTVRRTDRNRLDAIRHGHPIKRFANSDEVASLAYDLLYKHRYVNRTVIKMHGGAV